MIAPLMTAFLFLGVAANSPELDDAKSDTEATQDAATAQTTKDKSEKITDRNHPDYVRCRKEPVIGSRAKYRKICMTNAEWQFAARKGNEGARSIVASNQPGLRDGN